jgi:hypothetical protein
MQHAVPLNLIRHLLARPHYHKNECDLLNFDPAIVFAFDEARLVAGLFILKHMHDLSDEVLRARWLENRITSFSAAN